MVEQPDVIAAYGGQEAYRKIHEALARALAEPSAQGANAHGARAAFLLSQIAPQMVAGCLGASVQAFENAGAPESLLDRMSAFMTSGSTPRVEMDIQRVTAR